MSTSIEQAPMRGRKVGEIAAAIGGAAAVFNEFDLDLCRNGDVALEEAANDAGIDPATLERALTAAAGADATAAPPQETSELIAYIIARYHKTHSRELPGLVKLARKVEAVHASHPQVPHGLADTVQQLLGEIEVHMKKEELILFPAMRRNPDAVLDAPIAQMRHDHDDHDEHLRWLESRTDNFTPPEDACGAWRALYSGLAKFRQDLLDHTALENNVLFPRFEQAPAEPKAGGAHSAARLAAEAGLAQAKSAQEPPARGGDAVILASADPLASASLVPMLVGGLVLIVVAMIVALALS